MKRGIINIGIIPARGKSKGVIKKNLRTLGDMPLVAYGIFCSLSSPSIDLTIVSTDDPDIAEVSEKCGAKVIIRPEEFATDSAPTEPAMQHVVKELEIEGYTIDKIALIQCTCPFRLSRDIEAGFKILEESDGDAVMSVSEVFGHYHPYWQKKILVDGSLASLFKEPDIKHQILETERYWRRQDLPGSYYWKNGALYIMSRESLMVLGHRYGHKCMPLIIDASRLINIDTELDFKNAEEMLQSGEVKLDFTLIPIKK